MGHRKGGERDGNGFGNDKRKKQKPAEMEFRSGAHFHTRLKVRPIRPNRGTALSARCFTVKFQGEESSIESPSDLLRRVDGNKFVNVGVPYLTLYFAR